MPLISPSSRKKVDTTVFIPTFNGEKYLDRLLTAIEQQDYQGTVEILIIDSGSKDQTLGIISQHPMVRLVQIPSEDFGHGKTRNLAASLAKGTYITYLSHDAVPFDSSWLTNLIKPLKQSDKKCVAVFGKHIPRPNCPPVIKYGIEGVFAGCGPDNEVTYVGGKEISLENLSDAELFYSDVNSATTTDFLLNVISYQDVSYSEDLAFAKDLLSQGFIKAYTPFAPVEHSNDVTFREYGKRIFDENFGMRKVGEGRHKLNWFQAHLRSLRDIAVQGVRIIKDPDYSPAQKLKWLVLNPFYAFSKWQNIYRATRVDLGDSKKISRNSLEASKSL